MMEMPPCVGECLVLVHSWSGLAAEFGMAEFRVMLGFWCIRSRICETRF